ncbi:MAG: hypothetical protein AAFQ82_08925 [Myxococcota bacterium]
MSVSREEAGRDISAALSDIRGRRDQSVAEFDERLRLLEQIGEDLESGAVTPKAAQDRVRRLINERSSSTSRGVRAGRTKIGMRMPSEPTPSSAHANTLPVRAPMGPSPTVANAAIQKALGVLDARMVTLLTEPLSDGARKEARLELALLRAIRSSLTRALESLPQDVVLLASVIEFAEDVQQTLTDLIDGGSKRVKRLLEYDRELASQLVALGGSVTGVKEQLKKAQSLLGDDDSTLEKALAQALNAFDALSKELKKKFTDKEQSFLDQLV